jgi:hypothetical protein
MGNIMSQMPMLRSATTISPYVQTNALSDIDTIDIDSPPAVRREPKNLCPIHVQKNPTLPKQIFMARQKFISERAEGNAD